MWDQYAFIFYSSKSIFKSLKRQVKSAAECNPDPANTQLAEQSRIATEKGQGSFFTLLTILKA